MSCRCLFRRSSLILSIAIFSGSCAVSAEDLSTVVFQADAPLSALLEKIPAEPVSVSWLPSGSQLVRYDEARLDLEKSVPLIRDAYEQWCKARSGRRILQPREHNCAMLRRGLGCAVGELQQPGLGTDFERGLKSAAAGSGDKVEVTWSKASWVISKNTLLNIFVN